MNASTSAWTVPGTASRNTRTRRQPRRGVPAGPAGPVLHRFQLHDHAGPTSSRLQLLRMPGLLPPAAVPSPRPACRVEIGPGLPDAIVPGRERPAHAVSTLPITPACCGGARRELPFPPVSISSNAAPAPVGHSGTSARTSCARPADRIQGFLPRPFCLLDQACIMPPRMPALGRLPAGTHASRDSDQMSSSATRRCAAAAWPQLSSRLDERVSLSHTRRHLSMLAHCGSSAVSYVLAELPDGHEPPELRPL